MTDHISSARKTIERKQQELADTEAIVRSVGDELASRAKVIYDRSSWDDTIGGLGYEATWAEVAGLLAELPPSPLVYYKDRSYAGTILPAHSALAKAEEARSRQYTDETYDPIEAIISCAPFCVDVDRTSHYPTSAKVEWCVSALDGLIRVRVYIKQAEPIVKLGISMVKNGQGYVVDWHPTWDCRLLGGQVIRAGGKEGTYTDPHWPSYHLWWPEFTQWADVLPGEIS